MRFEPRVLCACKGTSWPKPLGLNVPVAFLDRDGVLNIDPGYVHKTEDLVWMPGALAALEKLKQAGYLTVVVTNQSGVSRGFFGEQDLHDFSAHMMATSSLDLTVYCVHQPDQGCPARKPATGMLDRIHDWIGVNKVRSFMVGDKPTDVECGLAFGVKSLQFPGGDLLAYLESVRVFG